MSIIYFQIRNLNFSRGKFRHKSCCPFKGLALTELNVKKGGNMAPFCFPPFCFLPLAPFCSAILFPSFKM